MNVSNEDVQWCEVKMPKSSSIQENYNCDQMGEILDQNEMDKRKCDAFVYSKDVFESSAVTEFDLVCNRNHLKASHSNLSIICSKLHWPFLFNSTKMRQHYVYYHSALLSL